MPSGISTDAAALEDQFKELQVHDIEDEEQFYGKAKSKTWYGKMSSRLFGSSKTSSAKIPSKAQDDAGLVAERVRSCRSPLASTNGGIRIQV